MLRSILTQLNIICILPVFWGNNENFLTNLSITAISAVLVGYFLMCWFFNGHFMSRNKILVILIYFSLNYNMYINKIEKKFISLSTYYICFRFTINVFRSKIKWI
jgi:hypothetical protein